MAGQPSKERTWSEWLQQTAPGKLFNWAVYGKDTPAKPFIDPKTKRAVTNSPVDPRTGRVTTPSQPFRGGMSGLEEILTNMKNNWGIVQGFEDIRGFVRSFGSLPELPGLLAAFNRSFSINKGMTPEQYYNRFIKINVDPSRGLAKNAAYSSSIRGGLYQRVPRPTDDQLRKMMQRDIDIGNGIANNFSYQTKDGGWKVDWYRLFRDISQDPTGTVATIATGGSKAALKGAAKLGSVAEAAETGSRLSKIATTGQKILKPAAKALDVTAKVLNPAVPLTAAALNSGPVRDAITIAKNAVTGRFEIYRPEFLQEWTPFKKAVTDQALASGYTAEEIASPEFQQRAFDMFNQQTNGRFADPFTPKAKKAFVDNNMDPADYAAPHIGGIVEDAINQKRGGITPAIMKEAQLKAAGATSVTRSAATGEAPGYFFGKQEGPARATTEGQMSEALSSRFAPPPGGRAPTHQDIADDFINTQVERRNAFGQSYADAAKNDGVYRDPNAFLSELENQTAAFLRQKGIDPSELTTNPDAFKNANAAIISSRTNINNHGATTPKIQEMVFGKRYTYDRQFGWVDDAGNPAPIGYQQALNKDPVIAGKIAAAPPPPVNRLSLENIEIERRSLNAAAQKAYEDGRSSGDFRNYNAIAARIDALDDTAIKMGADFTGDAGKAIPALQQARTQYREWRESGIGSQNPVVNTAAQQVMARTTFDPATGRYAFNDTPGSRNVVAQTFEGNLVGTGKSAPSATIGSGVKATNPAETYTALSKTLSPDGQNALKGVVLSEGYGRPGATVDDLGQLHSAYAGQGINLLTPEQERFLRLNTAARPDVSPTNIPQRDPFTFNPFATPEGQSKSGILNRASEIVAPFIKGGIGYTVGNAIGGPNLGYALTAGGGFEGPIRQNIKNVRSVASEQFGAPNFRVDVPNIRDPLSVAAAVGSQYAQGQGEQQVAAQDDAFFNAPAAAPASANTQAAPPPAANKAATAPAPVDYSKGDAAFFGAPTEADQIFAPPQPQNDDDFFAKPQARGGRAAYKAGGKVGSIEPLIQALMNKAKTAKKVSNKATEPLLNQHDNAIASALAVAQKAI